MSKPEYILRKDLPDAKAFSVLRYNEHANLYFFISCSGFPPLRGYPCHIVENNPEWFEKVEEKPKSKPIFLTIEGQKYELKEIRDYSFTVNQEKPYPLPYRREMLPFLLGHEKYGTFHYKAIIIGDKRYAIKTKNEEPCH